MLHYIQSTEYSVHYWSQHHRHPCRHATPCHGSATRNMPCEGSTPHAPGRKIWTRRGIERTQARPVSLHKLPLFSPVYRPGIRPLAAKAAAPPPSRTPPSTHREPCHVSCRAACPMTHPTERLACADSGCGRFMLWRRYPWPTSLRSLGGSMGLSWRPIFMPGLSTTSRL